MGKRLKIQCWNCPKTYFENLDIVEKQEIIVQCPYCNMRAVVSLRPCRKQTKTATIYRKENILPEAQGDEEFQLPEVLPSRKPE